MLLDHEKGKGKVECSGLEILEKSLPTKTLSSDDGLEAALLASGIPPDMLEEQHANEVLEYIRVEFLGSWGVEVDSQKLLEDHELAHQADEDPGLKKF